MTTDSIVWALNRVKESLPHHADELNALDGALGDGDLGVTLSRAAERLGTDPSTVTSDMGALFLNSAKAFSGASGSTYGTLLATGLMATAKQTKGRSTVPWQEITQLLAASGAAMAARGKSQLGDKTVLDVIEAARRATETIDDPAKLAGAALQAIDDAIVEFRSAPFKQGRARIFGEKGVGRDDPGMIAFKYIVESLLPTSKPE
ncbi:MAG TPA: DAK2 domain-containing protein [Bryobacteraceae bacterium]|nr:DAK2 domain-containing protein [Bryobacteraceae bacterium]